MTKSPALVPHTFLSTFIFALAIAGCAGSTMMTSTREMQSLAVTPASADAQSSPGGQVQFMATASFNLAPMTVTSPPVMWSIGNPFPMATPMPPMSMSQGASRKSNTSASASSMGGTPSVNGNGLAQCNGFVGNVTVQATAPVNPNMPISQMGAMTPMVAGMAQMMCP